MQPNFQQQEQQLRARILGMLERSTTTQPGGLGTPKEDKILEWTLFKIYEQMQEINRNMVSIAHKLK